MVHINNNDKDLFYGNEVVFFMSGVPDQQPLYILCCSRKWTHGSKITPTHERIIRINLIVFAYTEKN